MTIYAIIVTYNAMQWIDRCLESVRASSVEVKPVVIDNCSSDDTVAHIRKEYPEVALFVETQNLGFGQANNVGIRYALQNAGDYVLLLNQDAWIDADMIAKLLPFDDGKTVLSPVHLDGSHTNLDKNFRKCSVLRSGYADLLAGDELLGNAEGLKEAKEICAACWLIPREIVEKIGGFNPLFFHYNEDNNYQQRLFYHGFRIGWVGGCYVCHDRYYRPYQPQNLIRIRQELILRSSNINVSRSKGFLQQCRYALGVVHESVAMRYPSLVWRLLKAVCILATTGCGKVAASRKAEKNIQRNWL